MRFLASSHYSQGGEAGLEKLHIIMAQRRMFSKTITNSSQFLMMPSSSQNLYFHLGMNADDDGFCEHFSLMRMTDSKPDDLKILQAKGFVSVFDERVLVIKDWKENNYLRSDRYTPSKYLDVYKKELKRLSSGIPKVDDMATQVRIGKDRLGEVRKEEDTSETSSPDIGILIKSFEKLNPASKKFYGNTTQRSACQHLIDTYGLERVQVVIEKTLPKTNGLQFFPTITTPLQLQDKWVALESAVRKYQSDKKLKGIADINKQNEIQTIAG